MVDAEAHGLLGGAPAEMAEQYAGLLWGDLMVSLLLRVVDTPAPQEIARRARSAATAFLRIYPDRDQTLA